MLGRTDRRSRLTLLMVALASFAVAAALRLADWQVARGPELRTRVLAQLERPADIPTIRGRILDRNGRALALTGYRDQLVAYPKLMGDAEQRRETLDLLDRILKLSGTERAQVEELLADTVREYAVIDRRLSEDQSAAIREAIASGDLAAVGLEPQAVRLYPNPGGAPGTTLASQLLGFVTSDGRGSYGIEQQHDRHLAGRPTRVAAARDPYGQLLGSSARVLEPGVDGVDVRLTIDAGLQLQLEKELYAAWVTDRAKRVSGLIMDPRTGAVLAWASVPGYDANDFATAWQRRPAIFRDPIASDAYEPGSVMKMFTAAAALETGRVTPGGKVRDSRSLSFPPYTIRSADHKSLGWVPFRDAIAYSRNVATARTAARLGRNVKKSSAILHRMWSRLGVGRKTGIDLAGESAGIVPDPSRIPWTPVDLANRAFGQGVAITQVQLAAGYAPMMNGGFRVTPHFLAAVGDEPAPRARRQRVLRAPLAGHLHSILDHVTSAVSWYAEGSLIRRYQVGGKTGTAQIWLADKGYYSKDVFNFSFVGYVGGDRPAALVSVRIEEARVKSRSQGDIIISLKSYELFRRVAMNIISTLDLRRSTFPGAGFPEPLSAAEKKLTPDRFAKHFRLSRQGHNLLGPIYGRYQPGGRDDEKVRSGQGQRERPRTARAADWADATRGATGRDARGSRDASGTVRAAAREGGGGRSAARARADRARPSPGA